MQPISRQTVSDAQRAVPQHAVERAVQSLRSLHDGDRGVIEAIELGPCMIPALRALLSERDPSGLFNARLRAIDALAALEAYDVLADFLTSGRESGDPVERLGDQVVVSAAARGIARSRREWAFQLLLDLSHRHPWSGVIAALGSFRRKEAIPILTAALTEDETRMSAEAALKAMGPSARNALVEAANLREPTAANESESSLRRRRSALCLLIEMGLPSKLWPRLRHLMDESDIQVALLACKLCLDVAGREDRDAAIARLCQLRTGPPGWRGCRSISISVAMRSRRKSDRAHAREIDSGCLRDTNGLMLRSRSSPSCNVCETSSRASWVLRLMSSIEAGDGAVSARRRSGSAANRV